MTDTLEPGDQVLWHLQGGPPIPALVVEVLPDLEACRIAAAGVLTLVRTDGLTKLAATHERTPR